MKKILIVFGLIGLVIVCGLYVKKKYYDPRYRLEKAKIEVEKLSDNDEIQNGDVIFQTSLSRQSKLIQIATKSEYSHCGLIFQNGREYFVLEAVQPVRLTPLDKWIARGKDGKYVIKRLKNANQIFTLSVIEKMQQIGDQFKGKNYDLIFNWSDDEIYCSELIWKIYQRTTGLEIGKLQKLKDFDLSDKAVQEEMKVRYGDKIPMDETVVSPAAIFNSDLLVTIKSN